MNYTELLIKEFIHWDVFLHHNQYYLGRAYVLLKRVDAEDIVEIKKDEGKELFWLLKNLKSALKKSFSPQRINYAALCNEFPRVHVHIIPRYNEGMTFSGVYFKDENWGKNYSPYNKNFTVSKAVLNSIISEIKSNL